MGDFRVRQLYDDFDLSTMYKHALDDIEAFETLIKEKMFNNDVIHIGAEQELCIVDNTYDPSTMALEILDGIDDNHYTNELALFNLEINLDPYPLSGKSFSLMEQDLIDLLKMGKKVAARHNIEILLAGILPSLKYRHLQFEYMTPIKRYQTLSKALFKLRGQNFEIYLQGTDDLIKQLSSVLFEACNTSFQTHLQIPPEEFVDKHNWAQMISGPVLSTSVNSPLLFGKELWHETRIALFKQSLDTRSSAKYLRQKLPRVYFGTDWIKDSPADLWKNDIMRFPLILTSDDFKLSTDELKQGKIPELRGIRLHNGTTYTWNRMCYGHADDNPHLRIECRYIPSGPSIQDEYANFAFWIGLMSNLDKRGRDFWKKTDFRIAKTNFIKAARTGFNTVFDWFGRSVTAKELILEELLEQSYDGLMSFGVDEADAKSYLGIIEKRAQKEITGSQWIIDNYRYLNRKCGDVSAQKSIIKQSLEYQDNNVPVHKWENITQNLYIINHDEERVEEFMSRDIFSVKQNDSIDIARKILHWNDIHHVPVEDDEGDLVGMITDGIIDRIDTLNEKNLHFASQIMIVNPITIHAEESLTKAKQMMLDHKLSGLPVVFQGKLVGIITTHDFEH